MNLNLEHIHPQYQQFALCRVWFPVSIEAVS